MYITMRYDRWSLYICGRVNVIECVLLSVDINGCRGVLSRLADDLRDNNTGELAAMKAGKLCGILA